MNKTIIRPFHLLMVSIVFLLASCAEDDSLLPIPMTEQFEENLSAYYIFQGEWKDLIPASDYQLLELGSPLFSNYAKKQRLVKLPAGTQITQNGDGMPIFPDGTILVKTFYYFNDERDESLGKQVIETRLLIKKQDQWNVATYIWNNSQTEATLEQNGFDKSVSWTNTSGTTRTITYHFPSQTECVSCHQLHEEVVPLGPTLRNLNIEVSSNNNLVNQLAQLQAKGLLGDFDISQISQFPNYKNETLSVAERGRAYLEMNCAHCHRPAAWSESAGRRRFDFRYETAIGNTAILDRREEIIRVVEAGEMPFLGNTVIDDEGVALIVEFVEGL